jgi:hypothetical protein
MKLKLFTILGCLLAFLASCNNNDSDPDVVTTAYLRMEIDSVQWTATEEIKAWGDRKANISGNTDSAQLSMGIYIDSVGTFDMTDSLTNFFNYQAANGDLFVIRANRGRGTLTITEARTVNGQQELVGTFEGVAFTMDESDSIIITQGEFKGELE